MVALASPSTAHYPARKVLVIEDDTMVGMGLKSNLERMGHVVVGQAATADEARAMFDQTQPDLLLVDIRLDGADGLDLAGELTQRRRCPAIVVSAYSDRDLIDRAAQVGAYGYLIKPASGESLAAQVEVALRRFAENERLQAERDEMARTLEARKVVERAKGVFMKRLGLSEPDAHKRLQQESQRRRIPLVDLARKVIESEELLGG